MSDKKGCEGCSRLKSVNEAEPLPEGRNFWNSCPRSLTEMPTSPCSMGKPSKNKNGRVVQEPECPWWIDSEEHFYCFWRYIQANSLPDGRMDYSQQHEIAKLFACSPTKIHFIVKDAILKLKEKPNADALADFAKGSPMDGGDTASVPDQVQAAADADFSDSSD